MRGGEPLRVHLVSDRAGYPGRCLTSQAATGQARPGIPRPGLRRGSLFLPAFTPVRLGWAQVNGRFLVPAVILIAATGLPLLQEFRCGTLLIQEVAAVSIVSGTWSYLDHFVNGRRSVESIFLAAAAFLMALGYGLFYYRRRLASPARLAVVVSLSVVAFVGGMYACARVKNSFRLRAYSECITMHGFPNYWVDGLRGAGVRASATTDRVHLRPNECKRWRVYRSLWPALEQPPVVCFAECGRFLCTARCRLSGERTSVV